MKGLLLGLVFLVAQLATAQSVDTGQRKLLFADDFSASPLQKEWVVETAEKSADACSIVNGMLQLNTQDGITVWYKQKLSGNLLIEYDRTVVMDSGRNDRLSDLNQFWMATDPQGRMFRRSGGFREYDSLRMYYVGMGGNYNTTTRMRRYDGKGTLKIVGEYKDSLHLLQPNRIYHVAILVRNGVSRFFVDGEEIFSFTDEEPLTEGWFAFRSTRSRQRIDNFKIWQLN